MTSIDSSTAGPQRRVATRKRSLTSIHTRSATTTTKKLKSGEGETSQRPPKSHTQLDNSTAHDPCLLHGPSRSVTSAETQPLHTEGVFLSDDVDGCGRNEHPARPSLVVSKTPTKSCSHSEIETIQHKKPLFRLQSGVCGSNCSVKQNDPKTSSKSQRDGCISSADVAKMTVGPSSPLVWPGEDNDEEYWMLVAEVNSQNLQSASVTANPSPVAQLQQKEERETTSNCSPLPPIPRGPGLKNLVSSVKLHESPHTSDKLQTQDNLFAEWDGEDSFYDKLDVDQLIADSQRIKGAGRKSTFLSGKHVAEGVKQSNSLSQTWTVNCPNYAGRLSPDFGAHLEATQEGSTKCSVTRNNVLTNGWVHVPSPSLPDNLNKPLKSDGCHTHSETPQPEKWFSHIDSKTGNVPEQNCEDLSMHRPYSKAVERESLISHLQCCNDDVSSNCSNSKAPPYQNNVCPRESTELILNQLTTPKVSSAAGRLRQRLQNNARVTTPQQTRNSELRQAKVQEALTEMLGEASSVIDNDIGPFYGLPSKVAELLKTHRGIDKLYDWQHSCLTLPAIQEGRNLIYSLPTSGGKTLVAEILIMRQLLCNKKDALLVLPFVSIVQEKVASLSTFAVELGFLVEEYAGSKGAIPPRKHRKKKTLYIATIERAHSLVNSLILEERVESLGLVVVDELHMLGDGGRRGASLEACVAKLLHLNSAHVIGMSATLSNIQDLCDFMRAEVYCSDFRPVELKEYIKIEDNIFEVNQAALCPDDRFTHSRTVIFPYTRSMRQNDPDHLVGLALEVIPVHSCLVFCATKKSCQNVAEFICKHMPREEAKKLTYHKHKEKHILLQSLRRECDNHLCPTLKRTIPYGLAYHHSGLTMDERKLIEDAYSAGTLCLLTCTSTLAAGVNLPAKRVILRSPYIAQHLLTSTRYKQMVGRAGRAGIDSSGESILIIKPKQRQEIAELLSRPIEACYSSLTHDDGKGIRSLILTLIALKLTLHRDAVLGFMNQTLFGVQASCVGSDVGALTAEGLEQLLELNLVNERPNEQSQNASVSELTVTKLGQAAFKGSIDIDLCASIYGDLKQACDEGLVLANSLHLLYLVTPYDLVSSSNPNWVIYDRLYSKLSDGDLRVAELAGVTDRYLNFKVAGRKTHKPDEVTDFQVRRFYLTLMLWKISNQTSIWDIAAKFEVPRGFVQNLLTSAASFGSSVQRFCEDLPEFWAYQQLLTKVVHDLTYCAAADLVSLLEVPGVKQGRAKQLVRAGYKTLRHLAHADPSQLTMEVEHLPKRVAQQIVAAAKMELAERAEALREEAEELVTKPSLEDVTGAEPGPVTMTTETGRPG